MMPGQTGLLAASMIAGLISLDFNCFGPIMISQPVVAGPLFGLLLGNVPTGLAVGAIVQLLWMDVTPVGVGIPYDCTAVTILAVFWATAAPLHASFSLVLAIALAVPFGYFFRWMDQYARRLNTVICRRIESASDEKLPEALSVGIALGLFWAWVRYTLSYAICMAIGQKAAYLSMRIPGIHWFEQSLHMSIFLLPAAGLGVALEFFLSEPENRFIHFPWRRK
jgi:mannose/fructose/N-acetylgalactosamine-specific phosphotransferase system component IIC